MSKIGMIVWSPLDTKGLFFLCTFITKSDEYIDFDIE